MFNTIVYILTGLLCAVSATLEPTTLFTPILYILAALNFMWAAFELIDHQRS